MDSALENQRVAQLQAERRKRAAEAKRAAISKKKKPSIKKVLAGGKISNGEAMLWIGIAILVDGAQFLLVFIPVAGWIINKIISIFMWLSVYIWIKSKGLDAGVNVKKNPIYRLAIGGAIETIPIPGLSALPIWIVTIVVIIIGDRVSL